MQLPSFYAETSRTVGTDGTTITAHSTINTKGSYTELIASTSFESRMMILTLHPNTVLVNNLVDIAIGAASSEEPIVLNCFVAAPTGSANQEWSFVLPLYIPKGSRISARSQSDTTVATVDISVSLYSGNGPAFAFANAEGIDTATSLATRIISGGNVDGAAATLVASSAFEYGAIVAVPANDEAVTTRSAKQGYLDVGVEIATVDHWILENLPYTHDGSTEAVHPHCAFSFYVNIAKASKIIARAESRETNVDRKNIRAFILGLTGEVCG